MNDEMKLHKIKSENFTKDETAICVSLCNSVEIAETFSLNDPQNFVGSRFMPSKNLSFYIAGCQFSVSIGDPCIE